MSCGNRFQCGLSKPTRFSFKPDKPSNPELHNENQKRLNDMLKAREEMDKNYLPINTESQIKQQEQDQDQEQIVSYSPQVSYVDDDSNDKSMFTPWKVPSASVFNPK
jgi:hypothetical protein